MDYDATDIAQTYDRGRDHGPDVLDHWMRTLRAYVDGDAITTILDLGCGTGRFSSGLASSFNALVIGIDPSATMLQQAWRKRSNRVLDGEAVADNHISADSVRDGKISPDRVRAGEAAGRAKLHGLRGQNIGRR